MPSTVRARPYGGNRPGPRPKPDDPDILGTIEELVTEGVPVNHAAVYAGIHENTAYAWRDQGEATIGAADPDLGIEELGSHALFAWTLKQAQSRFVVNQVQAWHDSNDKYWVKHATFLERRDPANFGRSETRNVNVQQRSLSMVVNLNLDAEQALALASVLTRKAQELSEGEGVPQLIEGRGTVLDASGTPTPDSP